MKLIKGQPEMEGGEISASPYLQQWKWTVANHVSMECLLGLPNRPILKAEIKHFMLHLMLDYVT